MKTHLRLYFAVALLVLAATACSRTSTVNAKTGENGEAKPSIFRLFSKPQPIVVPAGTSLQVRLGQSLSTATSRPGDRFVGTLATPVVIDGKTVFQQGANVGGVVRDSAPSGRLKGRAVLAVAIDTIDVDGKPMTIDTTTRTRASGRHLKRNLAWIGGATGVGALIGGLAAGGQGAAIGAGSGAAAGTATAALTGKLNVGIPAETLLTFRLNQPVSVQRS